MNTFIPSFIPGYEDLTVNATSQIVSGLANETTYYYRVRAVNADGTSINSTPTIEVTTLDVTDPPVPLAATSIGTHSFVANWAPVDGATSYQLDVSTSPMFETPVIASDLMISEYVEGSNGDKVIELHNATGAPVNLSAYRIAIQTDGAGNYTAITPAPTGIIPNNATYVVAYSANPSAEVTAVADFLSASPTMNFTGNDAITLRKLPNTIIDRVGIPSDPADWGANVTLVRKSSVVNPSSTFAMSEWDSYPVDTFSNLGSHAASMVPSFVLGYEDLTVNGTSQFVSGLDPDTDYYYRVRAVGPGGTSVNSTPVIQVHTFPLTFGSITQGSVTCEVGMTTVNLSGLAPSSSYAVSFNLDNGPTQIADPVFVDAAGNATMEVGLANDGQTLTVTGIVRTDVPSSIEPVTTNNTVVLEVVPSVVHYQDLDLDGYGDINNPMPLCEAQPGWVLDSTDCDDMNPTINPGATEILFNGIDDNCDGNLDEGGQYVTQVQAPQCGSTLAMITSNIVATQLPLVTMYRFEVTDLETAQVQTFETGKNYFSLTALASYQYQRAYSVRVMVQRNGVWLGYYGASCTVSTPQVLVPGGAATINPSQCNSVLPTIGTLIAATSLPKVTGYKFRVTNISDPSAPNQVQIIERSHLHWFSLPMLANFNYGTTYTVEIAIRTTDDYSPYGASCSITTPPVPSLTNCGGAIATENTMITTASINYVMMYRFIVTNLDNSETSTIDRPLNWFKLNQVPNYIPGAVYDVKVAVMTAGHYSLPGQSCEIVAPGTVARMLDKGIAPDHSAIVFGATAYPNPFSASFGIKATTASESDFSIKVYDMTGRLVEDRHVTPSDLPILNLGEGYPSGVYNVILMQDENVRTMRVIRR
jgi:chitodextrinase